jgi:threonine/homoserine/homoserine lactone efflux protein
MSNLNNSFVSFLKQLSILTGILVLIYFAYLNLFPTQASPSKAIAIFIVLYMITAGGHYLYRLPGAHEPGKLIIFTLFSIVLKLVLYIAFAVVLILADKESAISNIVLFIILYLIYTLFDIIANRKQFKDSKAG